MAKVYRNGIFQLYFELTSLRTHREVGFKQPLKLAKCSIAGTKDIYPSPFTRGLT